MAPKALIAVLSLHHFNKYQTVKEFKGRRCQKRFQATIK